MTSVEIPMSKIKLEVVKILEAEGFIKGHEITTESKFPSIKVHLKYDNQRKPLIHKITRVSRPGLRVYTHTDELRPIRGGLATRILTTSSGVMTDREARKRKIGGEILCEVW
jgi:small subunit ribosomal protein S8